MQPSPAIFLPILLVSVLFFCWSMYRRLGLVLLGRRGEGNIDIGAGFREVLRYAVGQKRVTNRPFGLNHVVIFWCFIILFGANVQFMIAGVFPWVRLERLPDALHIPLMTLFDAASFAALAAVAVALV